MLPMYMEFKGHAVLLENSCLRFQGLDSQIQFECLKCRLAHHQNLLKLGINDDPGVRKLTE